MKNEEMEKRKTFVATVYIIEQRRALHRLQRIPRFLLQAVRTKITTVGRTCCLQGLPLTGVRTRNADTRLRRKIGRMVKRQGTRNW